MFRNCFYYLSMRLKAVWAFFMLLPIKVMAELPDAGQVAGDANTESPLEFIQDIASRGVDIAGPILAGVVSLGIGGYMFASFRDAREKGDWGKFGTTFVIGAILIVAVIVLAILAADYAEPTA
jgi:hypothetical protein